MRLLALLNRRWMQFSLRGLLFATLIVAIGLGTLAPNLQYANRQRAVAAMVAKYGGQVRYDFEDTRYRAGAPRRYPSRYGRLRKLLGEDFFYRVVAVEIGTRFHAYQSPAQAMLDDDGFRLIAALSELRILKVAGSRLTDEGAKRVSSLIHLEELQLSGPSIAEETVAAIAQLPRLRRLALMSPQITDAAIETIGSMKDLQEVDLRETSVSREGLNRLHELLPETWISH